MFSKLNENKIILTNNPFKTMKIAIKEKVMVLTPLTTISKLINFTKKGFLNLLFEDKGLHDASLISEEKISNFKKIVNECFDFDYLDYELDLEKIVKSIFKIDSEKTIDENNIKEILLIIDSFTKEKLVFCIFGFEKFDLPEFKSIVIVSLIQNLSSEIISWNNLESLVIVKEDDWFEVHDKDKLLSWLEMKTRMVLTLGDLDNYFKGKINMNTFLIERAFRVL